MKTHILLSILFAIGFATFLSVAKADDNNLPEAAAMPPSSVSAPAQAAPPASPPALTPATPSANTSANNSATTSAPRAQGVAPKPYATPRTKDLRFDEAVVEGMNNSSKDSLENSESRKNGNNKHLYQKRSSYRSEMQRFPSSMEYAP